MIQLIEEKAQIKQVYIYHSHKLQNPQYDQ